MDRALSNVSLSSGAAYYRGAMGILLVYDVTDESSFNSTHLPPAPIPAHALPLPSLLSPLDAPADIRNWIRNIEQHASDNVNKILVGNKADMDDSKRVSRAPPAIRQRFFVHLSDRTAHRPCRPRRARPSPMSTG